MSGGVRNLRAMFENTDPTSCSPDRGRSPVGSIGQESTGTSPRPLPKVKTSFVAVERSGGQLALQREASDDNSLVKRRESFTAEEEGRGRGVIKQGIMEAFEQEKDKLGLVETETIPDRAVESGSDEQPGITVQEDVKKEDCIVDASEAKEPSTAEKYSTRAAVNKMNGQTDATSKTLATVKASEKTISNTKAAKAALISPEKTITAPKQLPKKAISNPPTTSHKKPSNDMPSKLSYKNPMKKPSRESTMHPPVSAASAKAHALTKATAPIMNIAPPKTTASTLHTGSSQGKSPPHDKRHKPAPRAPTVPIHLPASLTAHTASSGSKSSTTAAPPARTSGTLQGSNPSQSHQASARPNSRASQIGLTRASKREGNSGRSQSIIQQGSTRPSFGPPPPKKQPTLTQSLPQQNAPADDGFLARMMRPTTSSASKTAEKSPSTPPKREQSSHKPANKDGPGNGHVTKSAVVPKVGKPVQMIKNAVKEKVGGAAAAVVKPRQKKEGKNNQGTESKGKVESAKSLHSVSSNSEEDKSARPASLLAGHADNMEDSQAARPAMAGVSSHLAKDSLEENLPQHTSSRAQPAVTSSIPISPVRLSIPSPAPIASSSPNQEAVAAFESPKTVATPAIASTTSNEAEAKSQAETAADLATMHSVVDTVPNENIKSVNEANDAVKIEESKKEADAAIAEETDHEDPEDAKAKAEIAALNATLLSQGEDGAHKK